MGVLLFKHLYLTIYSVSRQRNRLGLKAGNSDSNSVQLIKNLAWEDPLWPECWTLAQWGLNVCAHVVSAQLRNPHSWIESYLIGQQASAVKAPSIPILFYPPKTDRNIVYSQKVRIFHAKWKKNWTWKLRENLFQTKTKIYAAGLKLEFFHATHLPQTSWRRRTRLKLMFNWEKLLILFFRVL